MADLHADENFPLTAINMLRGLGHDITTPDQVGRAGLGLPDDDVLRYSASENRILITLNRRDFIHLHQISSDHAGIIVCTVDANLPALVERIHQVLAVESDLKGKLMRVVRPST